MRENWENHWKDYYQILQVHPSAEPEVVKAAFEKLARKYHPDVNEDLTASQRMKDINEAYDILSMPDKRNRYYQAFLQRMEKGRNSELHVGSKNEPKKQEIDISPKGAQLTRRTLAVGIDLGFNNSVIAAVKDGVPIVISNTAGKPTLPSYVAISKTGEFLVGEIAKRQAVANPEDTIYSIKRFIGRTWGETARRQWPVEEDARNKTYKVTHAVNNEVRVLMNAKEYSPTEISAMILQKLKTNATVFLGEKVTNAVITVPVYFTEAQRQATKDAGTIAGFNVLRVINEPVAVALAYGLNKKKNGTAAVFNLSRDAFDFSVLELVQGIPRLISTAGNSHLGGDAFDQRIIDWLCEEFRREQGTDPRQDQMALRRLKEAAEKAKIELSTAQETYVNLPFITADVNGCKDMKIILSRAKLEQLVTDLVEKTIILCKQVVDDTGKTTAQIDEVILIGWQTRMPLVQQQVRQFFGKEPNNSINPDKVFAEGAAIRAAVL
jgi:molecular chaperone DnaK